MQGTEACGDCVVTFVLRDLAGPIEFDPHQAEAVDLLADAGLVAPLRLVPLQDGEAGQAADAAAAG